MADSDYIAALVNYGLASPANKAALIAEAAALYPKIQAQGGRTLVSVSQPGQTVSWGSTMTLEDQFIALDLAIAQLNGKVNIFRRTTSRYF